jgi:hypothetical protein
MSRRLAPLPLLAVAGAMALAGCGGGGSSTTTKSAPTTASTPVSGVPANLQKAVAECHHLIESQKALSATAKTKLSEACDKAGKGDTQAVKKAAREVCEEVVQKAGSALPASAKETALAACRK